MGQGVRVSDVGMSRGFGVELRCLQAPDLTLSSSVSPYVALSSLSSVVSSVKWEWRGLLHRILC